MSRARFTLGAMLCAVQFALSNCFDIDMNQEKTGLNYALVLSRSGVDKSTFIAYRGAMLRQCRIEGGMRRPQFRFDYNAEEGKLYPEIGHGASERGFQVYQDYIDAADFFCTRGGEEDTCNMLGIRMVILRLAPTQLIVILSPNDFFEAYSPALQARKNFLS